MVQNDALYPDEQRDDIVYLNYHYRPGDDAGEISAIKRMKKFTDPDVPVFFLADDVRALTAAHTTKFSTQVNILGSIGFYNALHSNGLLPHIHVIPTFYRTITPTMTNNLVDQRTLQKKHFYDLASANDASQNCAFIKSATRDDINKQDKPFNKTLYALALERSPASPSYSIIQPASFGKVSLPMHHGLV